MFRECIWMKTVQKAKALFLVEKLIILKVLYPFCTVSISEWNCVNKWTYLLFLDAKWKNARSIDIHSGQLYYTEYLLERCKLSSVKFRPRMSLQNAIASSTFANRQKSITKKLQQRTRQSTKCCVLQTRNDSTVRKDFSIFDYVNINPEVKHIQLTSATRKSHKTGNAVIKSLYWFARKLLTGEHFHGHIFEKATRYLPHWC